MKAPLSGQKLRGGYYTPAEIARFLASWAIRRKLDRVLEPSCGDGAFVIEAARLLQSCGAGPAQIAKQLVACELHEEEAAKTEGRLAAVLGPRARLEVLVGDFSSHCLGQLGAKKFDAVIGNPPFIRYQNFPEPHREAAFKLMQRAGLHPNRLTNAWVPFIAQATQMLSPGGRLAMVVPAELLQVNYAAELREFLSNVLESLTVVTFRQLVFEGIQQEVVLLCGERGPEGHSIKTRIRTIELDNLRDLAQFAHRPFLTKDLKPMDHSKEKWTQYFLSSREIHLLRTLTVASGVLRLGELASVDVGVVTGQNDFFVLRKSILEHVGANGNAIRLVSRSGHLRGVVFGKADWARNAKDDLPAYLLSLPKVPENKLPKKVVSYIREGEGRGWHSGFKCRIRHPWYSVPSIWNPDGFMLRQIHDFPRIIVNDAAATCTDTIHRVRVNPGIKVSRLAAATFNSLSFAFAEVLGRSYGGGVLELEPREAESLPILYDAAENIDLKKLDRMLREGNAGGALDYADNMLLVKGLRMNARTVSAIRAIWEKLRDRRLNRKKSGTKRLRVETVLQKV